MGTPRKSRKKAPKSYLDHRRPPLHEALALEGGLLTEARQSLVKKGYFTPPPRPWSLGFNDRGNGRGDFAVLDKFGDLVVETQNLETAELIIALVNTGSQP
jgi:hypothetical protein